MLPWRDIGEKLSRSRDMPVVGSWSNLSLGIGFQSMLLLGIGLGLRLGSGLGFQYMFLLGIGLGLGLRSDYLLLLEG